MPTHRVLVLCCGTDATPHIPLTYYTSLEGHPPCSFCEALKTLQDARETIKRLTDVVASGQRPAFTPAK